MIGSFSIVTIVLVVTVLNEEGFLVAVIHLASRLQGWPKPDHNTPVSASLAQL